MAPLVEAERRGFLEICDERYQTKATLLTSQLPVAKWHAQIGDPTVADSILDRLVHTAHRIECKENRCAKSEAAKTEKNERRKRAVEMAGLWKAWKTKSRFSPLSTAPWKS